MALKFVIFFFHNHYYYFFLNIRKWKFMRIHFFSFLKTKCGKVCPKKIAKLKWSVRYKINQIPPKPKTPFNSQKLKNQKTSLSEDSSYLWCDVFVLSKITFIEFFFVLAAIAMSLFNPFLFSKNWNYPPKIQILTNVKTSPPQKNIKNIDDVLFGSKNAFKRVFLVLAALDFMLFVTTLLEIPLRFCWAFFDPFKWIWA